MVQSDKPAIKITEDQRLQAFALFMMAKHHSQETGRYFDGLARVLGFADRSAEPGHIADAIWGIDDAGSPSAFEQLLKTLNITIEGSQ